MIAQIHFESLGGPAILRRILSPYFQALLALSLILQACAPDRNYPNTGVQEMDPSTGNSIGTGGFTEVKDPDTSENVRTNFTISGSRDIYEKLAADVGSKTDQFLAYAVKDIRIVPLDKNNAVVKESPDRLRVQVEFKMPLSGLSTETVFVADLKKDSQGRSAQNVKQEDYNSESTPFATSIRCHNDHCSLVEIRLFRHDNKGATTGQIGALFSLTYPSLEVQTPNDGTQISNARLQELEKAARVAIAVKTSVVIVNGPSFSRITIPHVTPPAQPSQPSTSAPITEPKPVAANLVEIETELLDTADVAPEAKYVKMDQEDKVTARLTGNDPETGSLVIDLLLNETAEGQKQPQGVRVFIRDDQPAPNDQPAPKEQPSPKDQPKPQTPVTAPIGTIRTDTGVLKTSAANQSGAKMASHFSGYADHPKVRQKVQQLLTSEKGRIKGLLQNMPVFAPFIEKIFEAQGLTPELAYILAIESNYITAGNFNATVRNGQGSTATGPWQIVDLTAIHIRDSNRVNFVVTPSVKYDAATLRTRNFHDAAYRDQDDRTYFLQSNYMAALYLAEMTKRHSNDAALGVLAYNAGPGCSDGFVNGSRVETNRSRFDTTFGTLLQFRIKFEDGKCSSRQSAASAKARFESSMNYVIHFLALREIGQNPEKYNLNIQPAPIDPKKLNRWARPQGPLPKTVAL